MTASNRCPRIVTVLAARRFTLQSACLSLTRLSHQTSIPLWPAGIFLFLIDSLFLFIITAWCILYIVFCTWFICIYWPPCSPQLSYSLGLIRPIERVERGKVLLGPMTFGGPRHRSKILKMVLQMASCWPKICIKSFSRCSPRPLGPIVGWWGYTPLPTFPPSLKTYRMWFDRAPR